jgi:hypothetical protein
MSSDREISGSAASLDSACATGIGRVAYSIDARAHDLAT